MGWIPWGDYCLAPPRLAAPGETLVEGCLLSGPHIPVCKMGVNPALREGGESGGDRRPAAGHRSPFSHQREASGTLDVSVPPRPVAAHLSEQRERLLPRDLRESACSWGTARPIQVRLPQLPCFPAEVVAESERSSGWEPPVWASRLPV